MKRSPELKVPAETGYFAIIYSDMYTIASGVYGYIPDIGEGTRVFARWPFEGK
jgi:hypothetical protein